MSKEFEIARLQIIFAARQGLTDPVRAFAWSHRIYPFQPSELEEAFKEDFDVSSDDIGAVLTCIDDGWKSEKKTTFYEIEAKLRSDLDRGDIISVCRLAFLDGRFDTDVWKALTVAGSGPIESQGIALPFDLDTDIWI